MNKRRHELGKNELADRLETGIESVQSYVPWVLGGLAVLLVGSVGWGLYSSSTQRTATAAWEDYYFGLPRGFAAVSADSYLDLADEHPGSVAADWACCTAAASYLERGLGSIFVDKKEARRLINLAVEQYEKLADHDDAQLRAKALMGLAQSYESLGDVNKAVDYYEQVSKASTQSQILAKASERVAFLGSPAGKEFYTWFKTVKAEPAAPITLSPDLAVPPTTPGGMEFSTPDPEITPPPIPDVDLAPSGAVDASSGDAPAVAVPPVPNLELPAADEPVAPAVDEPVTPAADEPVAGDEPAATGDGS